MTGISISRIGQIAVNVKDLDRAVVFYRDTLGLTLQREAKGMAFFECGGQRLMLALPSKPQFDHPSSILYFEIDDVPGAYANLSEQGVHFEAPPFVVHRTETTELWMAFFRDTENNVHALSCTLPV